MPHKETDWESVVSKKDKADWKQDEIQKQAGRSPASSSGSSRAGADRYPGRLSHDTTKKKKSHPREAVSHS